MLSMESPKNVTYKEKNGTLITGTKQNFFIKSLQIPLNITPTSVSAQVSARFLMCCTDLLIIFLFSLNT